MLPCSPSNNRLAILPVLTWGVALAFVLFWSDAAVSSCGDYVMVGNPRHVVGMVHGDLTPFFLSKGLGGLQAEVVPLTPPETQGQRMNKLRPCKDFGQEVGIHHAADHLAALTVFYRMPFE